MTVAELDLTQHPVTSCTVTRSAGSWEVVLASLDGQSVRLRLTTDQLVALAKTAVLAL